MHRYQYLTNIPGDSDLNSPMTSLAPYFKRIGYSGPTTPTLETLTQLVFHHTTSIPFENLSVLLGHGISIDLPAVWNKLVEQHRGGYCFEQNTLLLYVLRVLGFEVTPLSARVRLGATRDMTPPRTHLFLKVLINGKPYLADVGVGGLSPTAPLKLDSSEAQSIPHETRRIHRENDRFYHQYDLGGSWADVCEFTGEEMPEIDRELGNHFTSTHPASKFRRNLMAALALKDGTRFALLNNEFTHRRGAEVLSTSVLNSPAELNRVLAEKFNLHFPATTHFGPIESPWPKPGL